LNAVVSIHNGAVPADFERSFSTRSQGFDKPFCADIPVRFELRSTQGAIRMQGLEWWQTHKLSFDPKLSVFKSFCSLAFGDTIT
jgi:hypothetical protein